MADVRANAAGASQTYLGIHVGAVHVHLAAIGMDDVAEFLDCLFIYPVRGGVRDHDAGEIVLMGFRLGFQVCHVDVASFVSFIVQEPRGIMASFRARSRDSRRRM